jgi:hypothetical protein
MNAILSAVENLPEKLNALMSIKIFRLELEMIFRHSDHGTGLFADEISFEVQGVERSAGIVRFRGGRNINPASKMGALLEGPAMAAIRKSRP